MTVIEVPLSEKTREEILLDAAAVIEEHGWTTGGKGMPGSHEHSGQFCILGAVAFVMGVTHDGHEGIDVYKTPSTLIFGVDRAEIAYEWNDDVAKDPKQVTQALRRLADGATWEEAIS